MEGDGVKSHYQRLEQKDQNLHLDIVLCNRLFSAVSKPTKVHVFDQMQVLA